MRDGRAGLASIGKLNSLCTANTQGIAGKLDAVGRINSYCQVSPDATSSPDLFCSDTLRFPSNIRKERSMVRVFTATFIAALLSTAALGQPAKSNEQQIRDRIDEFGLPGTNT